MDDISRYLFFYYLKKQQLYLGQKKITSRAIELEREREREREREPVNLRRNGSGISRGTSHATTTQRYQYTTSVDINNTRYKRIQSLIQNHMRHVRSESAREQRMTLYKSYE